MTREKLMQGTCRLALFCSFLYSALQAPNSPKSNPCSSSAWSTETIYNGGEVFKTIQEYMEEKYGKKIPLERLTLMIHEEQTKYLAWEKFITYNLNVADQIIDHCHLMEIHLKHAKPNTPEHLQIQHEKCTTALNKLLQKAQDFCSNIKECYSQSFEFIHREYKIKSSEYKRELEELVQNQNVTYRLIKRLNFESQEEPKIFREGYLSGKNIFEQIHKRLTSKINELARPLTIQEKDLVDLYLSRINRHFNTLLTNAEEKYFTLIQNLCFHDDYAVGHSQNLGLFVELHTIANHLQQLTPWLIDQERFFDNQWSKLRRQSCLIS